jgi:DNA-directed RNA polymerase subunit N (RpoN/RPB10)
MSKSFLVAQALPASLARPQLSLRRHREQPRRQPHLTFPHSHICFVAVAYSRYTKNYQNLKMIVPIRCFSCGKVLPPLFDLYAHILTESQVTGDLWEKYMNLLSDGADEA